VNLWQKNETAPDVPVQPATISASNAVNELAPQEPVSVESSRKDSFLEWLVAPAVGRWLLPATGLWILGLDWLLFSQNATSLGLATPLVVVAGFLLGTAGSYVFQRRFAADTRSAAWLKSIAAGLIVGVPLPLAGTVVGGWVLVNSGLASLKNYFRRG
jgi:hypothetical protein